MENQAPNQQPPNQTPPPAPGGNQPPQQPPAQAAPPPAAAGVETGGINLLPEIADNEIKSGVYRRKINVVALVVIGAIGVIIVLILLVRGYLFIQANLIEDQKKKATESIQKNANVEIKAIALKEKLDKIHKLLTTAIPASTFVDQVDKAAATSPALTITSVSLSANGEAFVDGASNNSDVFKQWVTNLTGQAGKDYFDKINLVALSGNPSEGYKFSVKITFLKKGVYQPK